MSGPTAYQAKLTRENAPLCKYCGLRLPRARRASGICDFCAQAHIGEDEFWKTEWETDRHIDAVRYEERGAYEPPPDRPRRDRDTIAVDNEIKQNAIDARRIYLEERRALREKRKAESS